MQVNAGETWVRVGGSRFLQTDPIPGGSANNYDYCDQDPINNIDLDGRMNVAPPGGGGGKHKRHKNNAAAAAGAGAEEAARVGLKILKEKRAEQLLSLIDETPHSVKGDALGRGAKDSSQFNIYKAKDGELYVWDGRKAMPIRTHIIVTEEYGVTTVKFGNVDVQESDAWLDPSVFTEDEGADP